MPSQIEKFNARKAKTEQMQAARHAKKQGDKAMTDALNKASSNLPEDLSKLSYEELFALMSKTPRENREALAKITHAFEQKLIAEGKINQSRITIEDELKKKYAEWMKKQENFYLSESTEQTEALVIVPQAETMAVNLYQPRNNDQYEEAEIIEEKPLALLPAHEEVDEEVRDEESWIEKKRKFWEEYALKNNLTPTHNIGEDNYSCELKDNEAKSKGFIYYESETNAQVSKDADLVMYKGLVTDAAVHGLSITFGETLDDKQKALLLAATLIHGNESGKKIEVVHTPTIDLNAAYFKELPKEAQDVLKLEKERLDRLAKIKEAKDKQASHAKAVCGLLPAHTETPRSKPAVTPQTNPAFMLPAHQTNRAER